MIDRTAPCGRPAGATLGEESVSFKSKSCSITDNTVLLIYI